MGDSSKAQRRTGRNKSKQAEEEEAVGPPMGATRSEVGRFVDRSLVDPPLEIFDGLQMNLGCPFWVVRPLVTYEKTWIKMLLGLILWVLGPILTVAFAVLSLLPVHLCWVVMVGGFHVLLVPFWLLPKAIRNRGVSDQLSTQAQLISLFMYPSRLLPMTLQTIRFGMTTVAWLNPHSRLLGIKEDEINIPERGVKGIWLHSAPQGVKDPPVLLWFFGGAFFAGTTKGNRGLAMRYAKHLGADVFLADYRLLPEASLEDAIVDAARAYEWLLTKKAPSKVVTLGISAGAGVLLRALQFAKSSDAKERRWAFHGRNPTPQPAATVLLGPYVDFDIADATSSLVRNSTMDWIVTQRVMEFCAPISLKINGPVEKLQNQSPLNRELSGLGPIFVSYSPHEACADMCSELARRLEAAGNQVGVFTADYMGHVFQVLPAFLPEARLAERCAIAWMQERLVERQGEAAKDGKGKAKSRKVK